MGEAQGSTADGASPHLHPRSVPEGRLTACGEQRPRSWAWHSGWGLPERRAADVLTAATKRKPREDGAQGLHPALCLPVSLAPCGAG